MKYTGFYLFLQDVEFIQKRIHPRDIYKELNKEGYNTMYHLYKEKGGYVEVTKWLQEVVHRNFNIQWTF